MPILVCTLLGIFENRVSSHKDTHGMFHSACNRDPIFCIVNACRLQKTFLLFYCVTLRNAGALSACYLYIFSASFFALFRVSNAIDTPISFRSSKAAGFEVVAIRLSSFFMLVFCTRNIKAVFILSCLQKLRDGVRVGLCNACVLMLMAILGLTCLFDINERCTLLCWGTNTIVYANYHATLVT